MILSHFGYIFEVVIMWCGCSLKEILQMCVQLSLGFDVVIVLCSLSFLESPEQ